MQGCLLDPSQREAFLQQVYEQLCLFEDKVATMLQQQYDPQSQVCGRESRWRPFKETIKRQKGEKRDKPQYGGKRGQKKGLRARVSQG